jgi:hypothetical protein
MKNPLFTTTANKKATAQETASQYSLEGSTPPLCPQTKKPMQKVICGTPDGKKFWAWVSTEARICLPAFKN